MIVPVSERNAPPFDIHELHIFLVAARTENFSEAARQLSLSQSAVSQQIRSLESKTGVQLFDRDGRSVCLTSAGQVLLPLAREIVAMTRHIKTVMHDANDKVVGTLRVSCGEAACSFLLPHIMRRFHSLYPEVRMVLRTCPPFDIIKQVLEGFVDVGVMSVPSAHPNLTTFPFFRDTFRLIVPADHPWAKRERVEPHELLGQPFVCQHHLSGCYHSVSKALALHSINVEDLNIVMEISDPQTVVRAVEQGLGVSLASMLLASTYVAAGRISALDVRDLLVTHETDFVFSNKIAASPVRDKFLAFASHPQTRAFIETLTDTLSI